MDQIIDYSEILESCIIEINTARSAIARKLNETTISVYWNIGKLLSEKSLNEGYGSGFIKNLSSDLKAAFPDMGLSPRNLWNMKRFYEHYQFADVKMRQAVALLLWGHNPLIMSKT
jgi:hypothetical protein